MINWLSFVEVLVAAVLGSAVVVSLYALALRPLAISGRVPFVPPARFDEAITVLTPKKMKKEARRIRRARSENPHSRAAQRAALVGAYVLFALTGVAVLAGIFLVIPYLHV